MSINAATTSSSVSSSASSSQVSSAASSDNAKKSSADSSFKDEMDKVSSSEAKKDDKGVEKSDENVNAVSDKADSKDAAQNQDTAGQNEQDEQLTLEGNVDKFATLSMNDVNSMLSNDIRQMMNTTGVNGVFGMGEVNKVSGMMTLDFSKTSSVSMTQSDAEFFVNLTQQNEISANNVVAQAQNMLNAGADVKEVKQNVQISQTLLNAINAAKETNQPLRIDFDQNVSVILRIGKEGAISANFIPGDKAVEQYLRNNIEALKATFDENDLPYTDLSYSNRGSKQQKENRRNKQD